MYLPGLSHILMGGSIQLIVEIAKPFIIVLISSLVVGICGMSPPSIKKEAEEESHDKPSVEAMRMRDENAVSLE
jgi:hypothetical protein